MDRILDFPFNVSRKFKRALFLGKKWLVIKRQLYILSLEFFQDEATGVVPAELQRSGKGVYVGTRSLFTSSHRLNRESYRLVAAFS